MNYEHGISFCKFRLPTYFDLFLWNWQNFSNRLSNQSDKCHLLLPWIKPLWNNIEKFGVSRVPSPFFQTWGNSQGPRWVFQSHPFDWMALTLTIHPHAFWLTSWNWNYWYTDLSCLAENLFQLEFPPIIDRKQQCNNRKKNSFHRLRCEFWLEIDIYEDCWESFVRSTLYCWKRCTF